MHQLILLRQRCTLLFFRNLYSGSRHFCDFNNQVAVLGRIWGSHGSGYVGFPGTLPIFQGPLLPPSSGKSLSETLANFYKTTQHQGTDIFMLSNYLSRIKFILTYISARKSSNWNKRLGNSSVCQFQLPECERCDLLRLFKMQRSLEQINEGSDPCPSITKQRGCYIKICWPILIRNICKTRIQLERIF